MFPPWPGAHPPHPRSLQHLRSSFHYAKWSRCHPPCHALRIDLDFTLSPSLSHSIPIPLCLPLSPSVSPTLPFSLYLPLSICCSLFHLLTHSPLSSITSTTPTTSWMHHQPFSIYSMLCYLNGTSLEKLTALAATQHAGVNSWTVLTGNRKSGGDGPNSQPRWREWLN